ncbi:uncharacterized protein LOC127798158 [Diospyros lotus]|uniref:uncharacterized protein LOC127798158 n=1 Tax=Diospyros lotus TaxID=55363 RepID=UPI0022525564|nr:uncharacterized protein LOC127798158 [Diospyros lotus]
MGRKQNKYCQYHRAHGHTTNLCHELKDKIEKLIQEGHLQRYVREDKEKDREPLRRGDRPEGQETRNHGQQERRRDHAQNPLDNELTQQAIHVISSGETLAGDNSSSRKAYAHLAYQVNYVGKIKENEDPMTFTPNDQGDVILPHDDPLVISIVITQHPIGKVLVDSGNYVSLIYWNCFK